MLQFLLYACAKCIQNCGTVGHDIGNGIGVSPKPTIQLQFIFLNHFLQLLQDATKFDIIFYQNLMAANQFDETTSESIASYRIYIA